MTQFQQRYSREYEALQAVLNDQQENLQTLAEVRTIFQTLNERIRQLEAGFSKNEV